jgi:hypothetical protein
MIHKPPHINSFLYYLEKESELMYEMDDIRSNITFITDELKHCTDDEREEELKVVLHDLLDRRECTARALKSARLDIAKKFDIYID